MKTLTLTLSLISSLLLSQASLATESSELSQRSAKIDTIVVVSQAEPANFEVYSLRLAKSAIDQSIELMTETFSDKAQKVVRRDAQTIGSEASAGSAI